MSHGIFSFIANLTLTDLALLTLFFLSLLLVIIFCLILIATQIKKFSTDMKKQHNVSLSHTKALANKIDSLNTTKKTFNEQLDTNIQNPQAYKQANHEHVSDVMPEVSMLNETNTSIPNIPISQNHESISELQELSKLKFFKPNLDNFINPTESNINTKIENQEENLPLLELTSENVSQNTYLTPTTTSEYITDENIKTSRIANEKYVDKDTFDTMKQVFSDVLQKTITQLVNNNNTQNSANLHTVVNSLNQTTNKQESLLSDLKQPIIESANSNQYYNNEIDDDSSYDPYSNFGWYINDNIDITPPSYVTTKNSFNTNKQKLPVNNKLFQSITRDSFIDEDYDYSSNVLNESRKDKQFIKEPSWANYPDKQEEKMYQQNTKDYTENTYYPSDSRNDYYDPEERIIPKYNKTEESTNVNLEQNPKLKYYSDDLTKVQRSPYPKSYTLNNKKIYIPRHAKKDDLISSKVHNEQLNRNTLTTPELKKSVLRIPVQDLSPINPHSTTEKVRSKYRQRSNSRTVEPKIVAKINVNDNNNYVARKYTKDATRSKYIKRHN